MSSGFSGWATHSNQMAACELAGKLLGDSSPGLTRDGAAGDDFLHQRQILLRLLACSIAFSLVSSIQPASDRFAMKSAASKIKVAVAAPFVHRAGRDHADLSRS